MSVDEHFRQAREHSETAGQLTRRASATRAGASWYPWYYYWDPAAPHDEVAGAHRLAGVDLELEVRTACAGVADSNQTSTLAEATGIQLIGRWVVFDFPADAGPPDRLLARLRCERTRKMLTSQRTSHAICLDGIVWTAHADAGGVDLIATAPDAAKAAELVRRARQEVR